MEDEIREYVLGEHEETVRAVLAVADPVAARLPAPADRALVESVMEYALRETGVMERFVGVIRGVVAATGYDLLAEPVADAPYVVVTGRGPLLRVTVEDARIVVCFAVFELADSMTGYVRAGSTPADVVSVTVRDV